MAIETVNTTERLAKLRALMKKHNIDVYVVPSGDAHSSEYIADCDARREFISGFTGSAGTAVVTLDKAALATDGRYFNHAAQQLDQNWLLLKTGLQDVPTWQDWAAGESAGGKTVGVDPTLVPTSVATELNESVKKAGGKELRAVEENLVDSIWGTDRPARPSKEVVFLPEKYTGKDTKTKLAELRKELEKKKLAGFVVSMLDEIAWLLNLRGSDIDFNPVFFSYALVTMDTATLYIDSSQLTTETQTYLKENDIAVKPYDSLFPDTKALAQSAQTNEEGEALQKMMVSNKASWALNLALGGDKLVKESRSPIQDAKSVKTATEQEGMRQCHIRDGAALIEFFAWLENQLVHERATLDEDQAATKLEEIRAKGENFVGLSFDTISSTGPNAAIIHYKPEPGNCSVIDANKIFLCDSGAQYFDGTTDTTRTLHFGQPSANEKAAYTLVLKGHIALDAAVFPKGTTGYALDAFARQFLWKEGLDYRHGTGHGVGSYLNVHEGPFGIGTRKAYADVALAPGNVTSIEPGYYEDGGFGIRLENMAIVQETKTKHTFGDKPFLGFEHVTMVPFCRNLLDIELLTAEETNWLNDYHNDVFAKTNVFFKDDPLTMEWLKRETATIRSVRVRGVSSGGHSSGHDHCS